MTLDFGNIPYIVDEKQNLHPIDLDLIISTTDLDQMTVQVLRLHTCVSTPTFQDKGVLVLHMTLYLNTRHFGPMWPCPSRWGTVQKDSKKWDLPQRPYKLNS